MREGIPSTPDSHRKCPVARDVLSGQDTAKRPEALDGRV